jgi:type IX secretion system PorP/SprF family membrane protein
MVWFFKHTIPLGFNSINHHFKDRFKKLKTGVMIKKILLTASLIISLNTVLNAQQEAQYTHYMYNTLAVNPAYAGSRGSLTAGLLHRSQWIGFKGSPMTQSLYAHTPLPNLNMGIGLTVVNDKLGPQQNTAIYGDYAYSLPLNATTRLAFGLKAGINLYGADGTKVTAADANDAFNVNSPLRLAPNVGAGLYLHSDRYYVGFSSPRILGTNAKLKSAVDSISNSLQEKRHFYLIGGLVLPINNDVKLKPTALVKMVSNSPLSIDLTAEALIQDKLSVGLGGRLYDAIYLMAGYNFTEQLKAGISYDFTTSRLRKANSGSIEGMVQYDFLFKKSKIKSPRYF